MVVLMRLFSCCITFHALTSIELCEFRQHFRRKDVDTAIRLFFPEECMESHILDAAVTSPQQYPRVVEAKAPIKWVLSKNVDRRDNARVLRRKFSLCYQSTDTPVLLSIVD